MFTPRACPAALLATVVFALVLSPRSPAADWPMYGRDATRNPASPETQAPTDWQVHPRDHDLAAPLPARNIKWEAALGDHAVGSPIVAGGLVWVCTNNP